MKNIQNKIPDIHKELYIKPSKLHFKMLNKTIFILDIFSYIVLKILPEEPECGTDHLMGLVRKTIINDEKYSR